MIYAKYRLSDGVFLCSWPSKPDYDPATEAIQEFPEHLRPDLRAERYDAASPTRKRPATVQELADYDATRADERVAVQFDSDKIVKALAIWTAQRLGVPLATARQEIVTIYKSL